MPRGCHATASLEVRARGGDGVTDVMGSKGAGGPSRAPGGIGSVPARAPGDGGSAAGGVPGSVDVPGIGDTREYVDWLIRRLSDGHPPRRAGTAAEREAQELVAGHLAQLGLPADFEGFRFSDDLYRVLALHFGLGALATLVAGRRPLLGASLHSLAAGSYWLDSSKRAEILRRALPYVDSQNLVATLAPTPQPKLRIVYLAHMDAALTGLLFDPRFVRIFSYKGTAAPYPARSLAVATHAEAAGAAVSLLRAALGGQSRALRRIELLLGIPAVISFLLNADVTRRQHVVPGAADDLSGVAGLMVLAQRFSSRPHPDVEMVFAVTGAEEAGTGGARRLCTAHRNDWDPTDTVIIGLDGLTN